LHLFAVAEGQHESRHTVHGLEPDDSSSTESCSLLMSARPKISFSVGVKFSVAEPAICGEKRAPRIDGPDFALAGDVIMGNGTADSPAFA